MKKHVSQRAKNWTAFIFGGAIPLVILAAILYLQDLYSHRGDSKHIVIVNGATAVFTGTGQDGCHSKRRPMISVPAGAKLPVRRIDYLKDCATLDVALPEGRTGYIILGDGDVSVSPPLPTI